MINPFHNIHDEMIADRLGDLDAKMELTAEITLTDLESKLVENTARNNFGDGVPGAMIWIESWDEGPHGAFVDRKSISGVFSSLVKKGLIESEGRQWNDADHRDDGCYRLTPAGVEAARALGFIEPEPTS